MSLNIKNTETCRLVDELSALTGESKTGAVTKAVRDRLERESRRRTVEARTRELLAVGERCAGLLSDGPEASAHADALFDSAGLPA